MLRRYKRILRVYPQQHRFSSGLLGKAPLEKSGVAPCQWKRVHGVWWVYGRCAMCTLQKELVGWLVGLGWAGLGWAGLGGVGLGWVVLCCVVLCCVALRCVVLCCVVWCWLVGWLVVLVCACFERSYIYLEPKWGPLFLLEQSLFCRVETRWNPTIRHQQVPGGAPGKPLLCKNKIVPWVLWNCWLCKWVLKEWSSFKQLSPKNIELLPGKWIIFGLRGYRYRQISPL